MMTRKLMLPLVTGLATIALSACSTMPSALNKDMGQMNDMGGMKQSMMMAHTGNADADFISNMIPHHQMAIDMSEKELQQGKDPQARQMAKDIIKAQKKEIGMMEKWLRTHGY